MSAMEYSASVLKLIGDKYNLPDDVLDLIAHECGLEYVYAFRATVLKDLTQPHFVRSLRNLQEQRNSEAWHRRQSPIHPGRWLVRLIRPQFDGFSTTRIYTKSTNIFGLTFNHEFGQYHDGLETNATHADLDALLTQFGHKRFKSKKRDAKIRLLLSTEP